jgi:ferrochelatase
LVNLGTPDATDTASVRRYLREFLSDPRVIEDQGLVWKFVLNVIILTRRPRVKARDYEKIWNREKNESPLKPSRARKSRNFAPSSRRSTLRSWSTGPCATAIPRSTRAWKRW